MSFLGCTKHITYMLHTSSQMCRSSSYSGSDSEGENAELENEADESPVELNNSFEEINFTDAETQLDQEDQKK